MRKDLPRKSADLPGGLAATEDNLREAGSELAMMVDSREPEIPVGHLGERFHQIFGVDLAGGVAPQ